MKTTDTLKGLKNVAERIGMRVRSNNGAYFLTKDGERLCVSYTLAELRESLLAYGGSHPEFADAILTELL